MWTKRNLVLFVVLFIASIVALLITVVMLTRDGGGKQLKDVNSDSSVVDKVALTATPSAHLMTSPPTPTNSDNNFDKGPTFSPSLDSPSTLSPFDTNSPFVQPPIALSSGPSIAVTASPSVSMAPSLPADQQPATTQMGSPHPSRANLPVPMAAKPTQTTFYAIADAPYDAIEESTLRTQIKSLPNDAEFLVHLGDIRKASRKKWCNRTEYENMAAMLHLSRAPVFLVVGDNEWNDCPNIQAGWNYWEQNFLDFESRYWPHHRFDVVRSPNRKENFFFVHKEVLFIGLNLVGGQVHDETEWSTRLKEQATWTMGLIGNYTGGDVLAPQAKAVIIFGHANPAETHADFFFPLQDYIQNAVENDISVLYMNGDGHAWLHESNFFGQKNFLRIQLTGGTLEPPLKVIVDPYEGKGNITTVFRYDRSLQ